MPEAPVIRVTGNGPDLVMVHGWGSHKGVWGDFSSHLAASFRLHLVDLPGHGESSHSGLGFTAAEFAAAVAEHTPPAAWLGSSLGGLVTIHAALGHPQNVKRMILISSNPSFVARPDWPHGQQRQVFEAFSARLDSGVAETLHHFASLEVAGSANARQTLRKLRDAQAILPSADALRAGLDILCSEDLISELAGIRVPALVIGGSEDRLVPVQALREAARRIPGALLHIVEGAGHAPFISHAQELSGLVSDFVQSERSS